MNMYNINKRTWRLLIGLLFTTLLVYVFKTSSPFTFSFDNRRNKAYDELALSDINLDDVLQPQQNDQVITINKEDTSEKKAFITFLCDDIMGEATQVLVHSLKKTNTKHDIVVLVLDDVTPIVRKRLEYLGAKIINVDQIKYPWDSSSARRKGFNKACRYSKLNLWNLTQYRKVVFLDADTMVVNSIDELFDYPQFTAAVDIGGVLNTGVFVAEPNATTYQDIMNTYENAPSYNRGDQGFLNYYFNQSANFLPGNYNLMIKFTHFSTLAQSFITKNTVKVLHFTSETKPWNFYFLHNREWRENYDGYLFGLWTRTLRQTRATLYAGGLRSDVPVGNGAELVNTWENKGRVEQVCDTRLKKTYGRRYPKVSQFTVILNLSSPSVNIQYLQNLLRMYASSKEVASIYINGNVIKDEDGERIMLNAAYLRSLHLRKPVRAVPSGHFKSVNNKFNPIQGIQTTAVFLADENVLTSLEDLEFGYEVWKKNQDAIVGFKPNSHSLQQSATQKHRFIEGLDTNSRYSMIESKSMFMKSDFLYGYTCLLPQEIHEYIDKYPVCHDIAINMLVSGQTGASPVLVHANYLFEFEDTHPHTINQRSQCLDDLTRLFNGKNPLVFNNEFVSKVALENVHTPFSWDTWSANADAMKRVIDAAQ